MNQPKFNNKIKYSILGGTLFLIATSLNLIFNDIPFKKNIYFFILPILMGIIIGFILGKKEDKLKNTVDKKSEQVERSKKLIDKIFYSTPNLIAVIDKNYNVQISNWTEHEDTPLEIRESKPKCYQVFQNCNKVCSDCNIEQVFQTKKEITYEKKNRKNDKYYEVTTIPILNENNDVETVIRTYIDITTKKEKEQALKKISNQDALTKICNRRGFNENIKFKVNLAIEEKTPFSIIMADIDSFKTYNDNYGHPKGDKILIEIAKTLKENIRKDIDIVARYGGEEFILFLPNTNLKEAKKVAEKLKEKIEQLKLEHNFSPIEKHITLSFGTASKLPKTKQDLDLIIQKADQALYKAKQNGKNRVM